MNDLRTPSRRVFLLGCRMQLSVGWARQRCFMDLYVQHTLEEITGADSSLKIIGIRLREEFRAGVRDEGPRWTF